MFGSNQNGNFMMVLELIVEFNPFLATHIAERGNSDQDGVSYLSSITCDEFISLNASKIRNTIIAEMKSSTYLFIIIDSMPDINHVDQLLLINRYVPVKQSKAIE